MKLPDLIDRLGHQILCLYFDRQLVRHIQEKASLFQLISILDDLE